ncbi:preprotein translocase subunit SecY [Eubacterium pyruvativorans]|uniref:preprotein translocase subunit SecY n=1 Tax=Eubacterium pyruvativorans TaxID=155865 RepID=UPI000889B058|nr:preprotein translocase subunit SecY [Eubacterium pyruvativorans]MDO5568186.1 preprotein translocase subunit SecY [Eubacteriales bacterium]MCI5746790.1 preprotein translocase subunit SecY [Eubacterium pyruvativorans]MDD6707025.1 preprotein translocase subunit SecY [Eubacterium pyruvativorans]MDY4049963.1 preprotein translocase subunit SecY [Eubacterium pyruvativorans]SDF34395.1 protein translocase subunit secY/sec61 alpha [Eubacterium pyruvativorans]
MEWLNTISRAWKIKELRSKMIFTLLMLVVYRIGSNIPVPGINRATLAQLFTGDNMGLFELFNLFSGGSFSQFTVFALSVTPYITASIIVELLGVAFPYFERLTEEGLEGRKKLTSITRYMTVVLAVIQALGLTLGLFRRAVANQNAFNFIVITLILVAGTTFLMWLGEQINEYGIGNGISLLIFGGIIARIPSEINNIRTSYQAGTTSFVSLLLFIAFAIVIIVAIIAVQQATRRIPVQYAKRVVGRKTYGGQSTHIPLKVNAGGVIPIIFALSILQFPLTLMYFFPDSAFYDFCNKYLSPSGNPGVWIYSVLNIVLILFFNYFYTAITFKPDEIAKNMKQQGGFIPGIRPGKATVDYLTNTMNRISVVGAIFLAIVATIPTVLSQYSGFQITFGGTSLLIAVGVAMDTVKQMENQMVMRNYKGFLK